MKDLEEQQRAYKQEKKRSQQEEKMAAALGTGGREGARESRVERGNDARGVLKEEEESHP